jgi:hypothetical protein
VKSLILIFALTLSHSVYSQEEGVPGTPPAEADLPPVPPTDPEAMRALEACIKAQTPGGNAPPIHSFQAELLVTLWEDDQGKRTAKPRSGTIIQYWTLKNEKVSYHRQLEVTGSASSTALISNGTSYWMQKTGEPTRNLAIDINLQKDLDALKAEIQRTTELMRAFFVSNLIGANTRFELLDKESEIELQNERSQNEPRVVKVTRILRFAKGEEPMLLTIGLTDHRLYRVEIGPTETGVYREAFHFEHHKLVKDGEGKSFLIPCVVQFLRDGQEILVARADEPHKIQFNTAISPRVFRPKI